MKYLEEHSEEFEAQEKGVEEEQIRVDKRRKTLRDLQGLLKKAKGIKKRIFRFGLNFTFFSILLCQIL